jgi:hypothetical protein
MIGTFDEYFIQTRIYLQIEELSKTFSIQNPLTSEPFFVETKRTFEFKENIWESVRLLGWQKENLSTIQKFMRILIGFWTSTDHLRTVVPIPQQTRKEIAEIYSHHSIQMMTVTALWMLSFENQIKIIQKLFLNSNKESKNPIKRNIWSKFFSRNWHNPSYPTFSWL